MPGYWYDDRKSDAPSSYGAGHSSYDTDRGGGGGDEGQQNQGQQDNLNRIRREAEERNRKQQEIDARNKEAAAQAAHAKQMQEMARGMQAVGQIGGGLSGGIYTKGPVAYPKHWYTPEGWAEVQQRGWSSKLYPEFQHKGEYSILGNEEYTEAEMDQYGKLQNLPEGVIYSTRIGDPERGWGGFKRVSNFSGDYPGGGGGWGSYGYGGGYGGGGGGGGGGYYDSPAGMPRGNPNELWGAQNPLQQMMISLHGGQGFQQGFARGGIVSLVT